MFAAGPGGNFDHANVEVVQRADEIDIGVSGGHFSSSTSNRRIGVIDCTGDLTIGERSEAFQRSECRGSHLRVVIGEPVPCRVDIAAMAGDRNFTSSGHDFKRSVRVITTNAALNAMMIANTAPMTTAMPALAAAAQTRRRTLGRL